MLTGVSLTCAKLVLTTPLEYHIVGRSIRNIRSAAAQNPLYELLAFHLVRAPTTVTYRLKTQPNNHAVAIAELDSGCEN